jgi:hypothetical protein
MGDLGFAGFISIIIAIALGLWYHYIRSRSEADSKLDKIKGIYFLLVVPWVLLDCAGQPAFHISISFLTR